MLTEQISRRRFVGKVSAMGVAALGLLEAETEASASEAIRPAHRKPNVIIILADDMGYSDLGCYGSEIHTPNLDSLAADGLRFTQFYNTARCWPSRAAIFTGYYAQQVRRDTVPGVPSGNAGKRPEWARLLPEMLRPLGYRSYHSGKWHLDGLPLQNGFDHSYCLNDHDRHFAPRLHTEDDKPLPPVAPGEAYYTSTAIASHAIKCLQEHASLYADSPFLSYLAFTAPHFPLHAPPEDIDRYAGVYDKGWDQLREDRWHRMQALQAGGTAISAIERDLGPPYPFPDDIAKLGPNEVNRPLVWSSLSAEQQKYQSQKMEIHAAMVDRMDHEVGRVLEQVRAMGSDTLANTLVLFLSDNGASAEMMVRGDGHDPSAKPGSEATFLSIGPGWSSMCNTPLRRHKTWVHEGGISTPLIVHWPAGVPARGETRNTPAHIIDIVPTVLEAATGKRVKPAQLLRRPAPTPPGRSLLPLLSRDLGVGNRTLWWHHEGNRALRTGNWKIVAAGEKSAWELYDLTSDRSETVNVADQQPARLRSLSAAWNRLSEKHIWQAKMDLHSAEEKPSEA